MEQSLFQIKGRFCLEVFNRTTTHVVFFSVASFRSTGLKNVSLHLILIKRISTSITAQSHCDKIFFFFNEKVLFPFWIWKKKKSVCSSEHRVLRFIPRKFLLSLTIKFRSMFTTIHSTGCCAQLSSFSGPTNFFFFSPFHGSKVRPTVLM